MIDLSLLKKEVRDRLLLKEATDTTFGEALSNDYTETMFETLLERKNPNKEHSYIGTMYGQQGSSKSYSSLALSGFLDDNFSAEKIYFDVEDLVNDKHKLKSHDCVLVDEQARTYGIDSNRINIMIQIIKEQLRKRSIHMFFCSPTLKDEHTTSMYIFETLFIDEKKKLSYCAYKTNELHCLGYSMIPHPLNFINKQTLLEYEKKKDEHLDEILKEPKDSVEERSRLVMAHDIFMKAEKLYLKARGYIPHKVLVQIVEKIFPEFKGSVIVFELSDRVKANCEIENRWKIVAG